MKKLLLIFIMICLCPLYVQAADFIFDKGITWDLTQKEILKLEKKSGAKVKSKNSDQAVVKANYRQHKDVNIIYNFANGQLTAIEYTITYFTTVNNDSLYYTDYQAVVNDLTDSYGKPDDEGLRWKITDQTLKNGFETQNKLGLAVSMGYLEASANWKLKDENMSIEVLLFSPKELKAAIKVTYTRLQ